MPAKIHQSLSARPGYSARGAHPIPAAIFTLLLLALGGTVFFFGTKPIASGYFEYPSRELFTLGSLGIDGPEGLRILDGPDAIFLGLAVCALGVMFCLWGVGVVGASLARRKQSTEAGPFGRFIAWLSFVSLLVAILCLFPPWRLDSLTFYLASILAVGSFAYPGRGKLAEVPSIVFGGLVITAIVAANIRLGWVTVNIVLALVAMMFVGIHVLILAPQLMTRQPGEKEWKERRERKQRKKRKPSESFDD